MADGGIERVEAMFGAISKIAAGEESTDLLDARCPKCKASNFVRVSDLFYEAVGRLEGQPETGGVRVGGMTDTQIVQKFRAPRRKSAVPLVVAVAIPLGGAAYFLYRRYGDNIGQISIMVASVATLIVFLTSVRRLSDRYYHERRRWNSLFMCRECGQLVSS